LDTQPIAVSRRRRNKLEKLGLVGFPTSGSNSFKYCAQEVLKREGRPLSATTIVKLGIKDGLLSTIGKTPQNTLASVLYCEIKKDPQCVFTKVAPMTFGLKEFGERNIIEKKPKRGRKKKQVPP